MTPNQNDDLIRFARSLPPSRTYEDRYAEILEYGFRQYLWIPNVKALRDVAGGGSASTAQAAIQSFLAEIQRKSGHKVAFSAEVPQQLADRLGQVVLEIIRDAGTQASAAFDAERAAINEQLSTAQSQLQAAQEMREASATRIADLTGQVASLQATAQSREHAIEELNRRNEDTARLADSLRQEVARLTGVADELKEQLARAASEAVNERDSMRKAHMLALDQVRTESKQREAGLTSQAEALRGQLEAKNAQLNSQAKEAALLAAQMEQCKADLGTANAAKDAALDQSKRDHTIIATLQSTAQSQAAVIADLQERLKVAEQSVTESSGRIAELLASTGRDPGSSASEAPPAPKAGRSARRK